MILLGIDVSRNQNLHVTCHPDDRAMLSAALENMPVVIVESKKRKRGEWLMRVVPRLAAVLVVALCCGCAPRTAEPYIEPRHEYTPAARIADAPVAASTDGIALNVVEKWRNWLIEGLRLLRRGDANGREIIVAVLREMYVATGTAGPSGATLPNATQATLPPATEDNANVRGVLKRKDEAFAEMDREDKK